MFDIGFKTDTGQKRLINEDSIYICQKDDVIQLYIVADGMGGHNAGEIASKLAVEQVVEQLNNQEVLFDSDINNRHNITKAIAEAIQKANKYIYDKAFNDKSLVGMGTTLNAVIIKKNKMYFANVGDSRAYVIRRDKIYQITKDHSLVEQLVKNGEITREEARKHPKRNVITRALGSEPYTEVDTYVRRFFNNDVYMLCSDGLYSMIENDEILNIVQSNESAQEIADKLVEAANKAGGKDNISVIIIKKRGVN